MAFFENLERHNGSVEEIEMSMFHGEIKRAEDPEQVPERVEGAGIPPHGPEDARVGHAMEVCPGNDEL